MALSSKHQVIDSEYLLHRAEAEVALAEEAANLQVAQTHRKLASAYFDRLFADGTVVVPERNQRDVVRENRAALTALFGGWKIEPQNAGLRNLLEVLEVRSCR